MQTVANKTRRIKHPRALVAETRELCLRLGRPFASVPGGLAIGHHPQYGYTLMVFSANSDPLHFQPLAHNRLTASWDQSEWADSRVALAAIRDLVDQLEAETAGVA